MQADDLSGEGLCRHRNGELQRACDYYSRVLAERPDHFLALNNAALIARDFGRIEMALTLLAETENTNQQLLELATVRSDQYLLPGPANDARPLLERSINIQPKKFQGAIIARRDVQSAGWQEGTAGLRGAAC